MVANINGTAGGTADTVNGGSVTTYPLFSSGNVAPSRTLTGPPVAGTAHNAIYQPCEVVIDSRGDIIVDNHDNVTTFAPGSIGTNAPETILTGTYSTLGNGGSEGMAVDRADNLYLTNDASSSISVFPRGAEGDAQPTRTIAGPLTTLASPLGIAVAPNGLIVVTDAGPGYAGPYRVLIFAPRANGNVAPLKIISGPQTGLDVPAPVTLDERLDVIVGNAGNSTVETFSSYASGNAAPTRTFGAGDGVNTPIGLTVAGHDLFVANAGNNSITAYHLNDRTHSAPFDTVSGPATGLQTPTSVKVVFPDR